MSFDPEPCLTTLKPFQRATVDYVTGRFQAGAQRFLVADEVGLGKTRIAQGVISVMMSQLAPGERADFIYVCSNQEIARQNLKILNVLDQNTDLPGRLTLYAHPDVQMRFRNGANFMSLTPGTSFERNSGLGWASERALIYQFLKNEVPRKNLSNLLQGGVRTRERWESYRDQVSAISPLTRSTVAAELLSDGLRERISASQRLSQEEHAPITGILLHRLAAYSLKMLKPKLIIFDEFQRFHDLFSDRESDAHILMRRFLGAQDNGAKVLFLSATPYKMQTIKEDDPEQADHQKSFLDAVAMLHGGGEAGKAAASDLKEEMRAFRQHLRLYAQDLPNKAADKRDQVQSHLRQVMSRQERVAEASNNAGLDRVAQEADVLAGDVRQAMAVEAVARHVGEHIQARYWKSAPYLFSFMPADFVLPRKIAAAQDRAALMQHGLPALLPRKRIDSFKEVPPDNGRLRLLMQSVLGTGDIHKRLWLPASLPYLSHQPRLTKSLIFSEWQMVPDAIAAMVSYEAERKLRHERGIKGSAKHSKSAALRLSRSPKDHGSSMREMLLLYPSDFLAHVVDPLAIWREHGELGAAAMLAEAKRLVSAALAGRSIPAVTGASPWELIAWLDRADDRFFAPDWFEKVKTGLKRDGGKGRQGAEKGGNAMLLLDGFVAPAIEHNSPDQAMGPAGDATVTFLARVALGSPAVCLLRSLRRYADVISSDLAQAAAAMAPGFLTTFNHREARPLLMGRGEEGPWSKVIDYCAEHDLQAVLDEYFFQLTGGKLKAGALMDRDGIVDQVSDSIGLRTAPISARNPFTGDSSQSFTMPSHVAARFAANVKRSEDGSKTRPGALRAAFNSPFRPFVLASTSVGQEGLDFHHYCHRIWHWNLPDSPADLEQREGRLQRYLNHAVRWNIATCHGAAARRQDGPAWPLMLAAAESEVMGQGLSRQGMCPHWLYTGGLAAPARIESILPLPSFSKEAGDAPWLQKTTALYRLAFGQPRQADLLAILDNATDKNPQSLMICLKPQNLPHVSLE